MKKILVTNEFCDGAKQLVNKNFTEAVNNLRTALILLANDKPIPKKFKDHRLTDSDFRELHISKDNLLLYRNDFDNDTLIVTLKLATISNHKKINKDSFRNNYQYKEVTTQGLHDITSSTDVYQSSIDEVFLNDALYSIEDYACEYLDTGYITLSDYYVNDNEVVCTFDHMLDEEISLNSISFIIDLNKYPVESLAHNVRSFANQVADAFKDQTY